MLPQIQTYKLSSTVKLILKILISVLIVSIIVKHVNISNVMGLVLQSNILLIISAMLLFIASKIVSAVRYQMFLLGDAVHLNFIENLKLYWLGMYYNLLLPGGISGDGYKIKVLFQNFKKEFKILLRLTVMDRFSGVWALGQIALGLVLIINPFESYFWLIVIMLIASIAIPWILNGCFKWMDPKLFGKINLISLGVQLLQTGSAICLIISMGQKLHWISYSFLFLVSSLAAMLPFTFGGAGARELTFLYGTQYLQTDAEKGVAIAFLFYLISTLVSLFGIVYSFKPIIFKNRNK